MAHRGLSTWWFPGRSPRASCCPLPGPGGTMELSPNSTDLRTNQALEAPGWESVPSGDLHPGRSAVGIGMAWVNGGKMNWLGGKGSITAPVVQAFIVVL